MHNVVTVLRSGGVFNEQYVRHLMAGVARHAHTQHRFMCLSDTVTEPEVRDGIEWLPLVHDWPAHYAKLEIYRPELEWFGRMTYIDLSSVIVGDLTPFLDYDGPCAMVRDPWHDAAQTSVITFEPGWGREPYLAFSAASDDWMREGERMHAPWFHDQVMLQIRQPDDLFAPGAVVSWKAHCTNGVPENARIVKFHGRPKPHEVDWARAQWSGEPVPVTRGVVGDGASPVAPSQLEAHIRAALLQGHPQVSPSAEHDRAIAICGAGPSLDGALEFLRTPGLVVLALNGAHDHLLGHGIRPWAQSIMDPDERVLRHLNPVEGVLYLMASGVHPSAWERLDGHSVALWHVYDDVTQCLAAELGLTMLIGGGCTVGTRAINLAHHLGFRTIHLIGMDSCYVGGTDHVHADSERETFTVTCGDREFEVNQAWARQAIDFKEMMTLHDYGEVVVHGDGLLAQIARQSRLLEAA